jgi:WD40 repeat protein
MGMRVVGIGAWGLSILLGAASPATAQGAPDIQWMRGGHSSYIGQVLYASDGTFLVTASSDQTVKIWRTSDWHLVRTLTMPGLVGVAALSPDNATLCAASANASSNSYIRCWHVADGAQIWDVDVASTVSGVALGDAVGRMEFSPDGARLATAVGFRLPIFNAANGGFLADFWNAGGHHFAGGLAFSPDGQVLAVNDANTNLLATINATTGAFIGDFPGVSIAYDVAISPDSQLTATVNGAGLRAYGTYDHVDRLFDTSFGTTTVTFSPSGARIAGGTVNTGGLTLWNTSTGHIVRQWDAHGPSGYRPSVAFSSDSTKLISANLDIRRWRASDGAFDSYVTTQTGPVWLMALSANEQVVAIATAPGVTAFGTIDQHALNLYRGSDGALLRTIDYGSALPPRGIALSPDGRHVALSDSAGMREWNVDTGVLERSHAESSGTSGWRPLAFTPDGTGIAEGGDAMTTVSLWKPGVDTLTPIVNARATALRFLPAPDGRLVIAGQISPVAYDSFVSIVTLAGHVDRQNFGLQVVSSVEVNRDGTKIVATGLDGAYSPFYVARIIRVSDGATLTTLSGHTNNVRSAAFAWNSNTVITGSQDNTLRIWDAGTGDQLQLYDSETGNAFNNTYGGIWTVAASTQSGRFVYGRGDATLVAAINPFAQPKVQTFTVPAITTGGCKAASAKVVLDGAAPPAGVTLSLGSDSASASVPNSLTIKGGMTSKTFKITTDAVTALESATISATLDGHTSDGVLGIRPIGIKSLTFSQDTITGGSPVTGTVTLECNATPGDIVVHVASSLPLVALPDATVTILHGTDSNTFNIATTAVTATKKPNITATTFADALSKAKKLIVTQ